MIEVTKDPARRLVHARMSGMLTVAEVDVFSRDEQAAAGAMGLGSGEFDLLIEALGDVVQSQDVMARFRALITESPLKARRIAVVRHSVLARMQSKRQAQERDGMEVFADMGEAEAWLAA